MPSHRGRGAPVHRPLLPPARRLRGRLRAVLASFMGLLVIAVVGFFASGMGVPILERQAAHALTSFAPAGFAVHADGSRFAFDLPASMGVTFERVTLTDQADGSVRVRADALAVTFEPGSLIVGEPAISGVSIVGAAIQAPVGRVGFDPYDIAGYDKHAERLVSALERANTLLRDVSGGLAVSMQDVTLHRGEKAQLRIIDGDLRADEASIAGRVVFDEVVEHGFDGYRPSVRVSRKKDAGGQIALEGVVLRSPAAR